MLPALTSCSLLCALLPAALLAMLRIALHAALCGAACLPSGSLGCLAAHLIDSCEYQFHHPYQKKVVQMVMWYRDMAQVSWPLAVHAGTVAESLDKCDGVVWVGLGQLCGEIAQMRVVCL